MRNVLFSCLLVVSAAAVAADKPIVNLKVEGEDAKKLAAAMKDGGVAKEPFASIPNDPDESGHPRYVLDTEMVHRAETIACRETKCDPFKLDAKRAKEVAGVLKKIGVEELKAPKQKPLFFVKEMVCAAPPENATGAAAAPVCYVSAHFKPKTAPKAAPKKK